MVQKLNWSTPPNGWLKASVDGAKPLDMAYGGGGVVLCDHHGRFVAGATHFLLHYVMLSG
jgi:hypothetical protein